MDNSWWIELGGLRLLVDPWLEGEEVDGFRWFNVQWHRTAPIDYGALPEYDAVLITQKYPDHLHAETLRRLNPQRVIAPASTRKRLSRLLPDSDLSYLGVKSPALTMGGIHFGWLPTHRRIDPVYDAVVLDSGQESVLVATHGINLDERHQAILQGASPCRLVISPFNHYRLPAAFGGVVTPGMDGLRQLVERLDPHRVVQTHDEDKYARGLVKHLASVKRFATTNVEHYPWLAPRYLALKDYEEVHV